MGNIVNKEIDNLLNEYISIGLDEVAKVQLMDRVDRKYIVPLQIIPKLLGQIEEFYFVQEINKKRKSSYSTLYYDTPDFYFYHSHVNGKLNRTKVRIRRYDDVDIQFLEAKLKSNKGRTTKERIKRESFYGMDSVGTDFLDNYLDFIDSKDLKPVLTNSFRRTTLVNKQFNERITIDFDLSFQNYEKTKSLDAPSLCIIEIKQNKRGFSPIGLALRDMRIRKTGISKYCLGISTLFDEVKSNRYRAKVRQIEKRTKDRLIINIENENNNV